VALDELNININNPITAGQEMISIIWGYSPQANPHALVSIVSRETSFRAVVEVASGDSRIFSGESVRLKCSIPDVHKFSWHCLWFKGSEQLPQSGEHLFLWKTKVQESGKFYCQGVRDTIIGQIRTLQSIPLEINVDGKIFF